MKTFILKRWFTLLYFNAIPNNKIFVIEILFFLMSFVFSSPNDFPLIIQCKIGVFTQLHVVNLLINKNYDFFLIYFWAIKEKEKKNQLFDNICLTDFNKTITL